MAGVEERGKTARRGAGMEGMEGKDGRCLTREKQEIEGRLGKQCTGSSQPWLALTSFNWFS